jgi:choline-glycine betaine transporter
MKHSEMNEKWKEKSDAYIHSRWKQLNDLTREYTTYATKYCFATNSGGAIALLSYFGVFKGSPDLPNLKYVLCIFLVGILFAAGPILILLHEFVNLLREWGG